MKPLVVLGVLAWLVGLIVVTNSLANVAEARLATAAPAEGQLSATLAALTVDDWSDLIDASTDAQTAHGDAINAAVLLRSGKVPGTDVLLTLEQQTQLLAKISASHAKAAKRNYDAAQIAQVSAPQLDAAAAAVPHKLTRREIAATAAATPR